MKRFFTAFAVVLAMGVAALTASVAVAGDYGRFMDTQRSAPAMALNTALASVDLTDPRQIGFGVGYVDQTEDLALSSKASFSLGKVGHGTIGAAVDKNANFAVGAGLVFNY